MYLDDVSWGDIFGYKGLINIANFMLAFYVLISCLRSRRDLDLLINVLLICAVTRGFWGAGRFIAFGGDSANFYANFQFIDVKLTFFDINDSLIAVMALFLASWRLATGQCQTSRARAAHLLIVALELFIIIFSYRRTAWGGLVIAALLFAFSQPGPIRKNLLVGYATVGIPILLYSFFQRAGADTAGYSVLERMAPDLIVGGEFSFTSGRFTELYAALLSIAVTF